jgi:nitrite reductase/ring-hydroxylating ferredoxin subunit
MKPNTTRPESTSVPESSRSTHRCAEAHRCGATQTAYPLILQAQETLSRRNFVRTFALFSAASWWGGSELKSLLVADVQAQSSNLPGIFRMNLDNAAFASLRNEVGSVRLAVAGMPASFRQIIVSRLEGSQFFAVTSQCAHEGQPVSAMNLTSRRLVCPSHGSQYAANGALLVGPATRGLTAYTTTFDGVKTVSIEIPNLGFLVSTESLANPATGQKRLRLQFPTVSNIRYDVQFRPALTGGAWTRVPFATAIDGAVNVTTLTGNNTVATVFVEPGSESGFYAIGRGVAA